MRGNLSALESAVVGINVMDVESTINPSILARVYRSVSDAFNLGEMGVDTCAVSTENRIRVYQRA